MPAMTEEDIAALVSAEIEGAQSYGRSERDESHVKAIEYYRGEMNDLPAEEGRSSVTDHTVQDVIGWILPGLMRVFFGGEEVATYEPQSEEDEPGAKQATDYVNNIVLKECNAYQVFWDCFHDALLHRNGVCKHFWDSTPVTKIQVMSCISEDQMAQILEHDGHPEDVEVLAHTERPPVMLQLAPDMPPEPIVYHDLKIKVVTAKGTLRLMAVPPEDFLIDREAVDIEDARFVAHRTMKTRSELVLMGFDRDEVDDLPAFGSALSESVKTARQEDSAGVKGYPGKDKASEEIELFECYVETDHDGDGETEMLRVYAAGPSAAKVLDWDVWEDDVVFSDLTPERVPHRWQGRSVFDDLQDVQRIKTVLTRNLLDNLYQTNIPDRAVDDSRVKNPDALFDRKIGNVIRTEGDPSTVVANLEVPFTAGHSFTALEYFDSVTEKRTGVSKASQGLDPETLQNQSATAANIQQSASYSKIELIARNMREMGMKRVFRAILRLVVKHQDRPRMVRLRNKWEEMDPRGWNADMDVTVNVGLGSGSRDRDLMYLGAILQQQQSLLNLAGGVGTTYGRKVAKAVNVTMTKMVEAAGLKSPDTYFPQVTDEELEELAQAAAQSNPEAAKAQAQMQLEQQKAESAGQLEQMKAGIQAQLDQQKAETQAQVDMSKAQSAAEIERIQAEADVAVKQRESEAKAALAEREFQFKAQLAQQQMEYDRELKLLEHQLRMKEADYKGQQAMIAAKEMAKNKPNGADKRTP